MTIDNTKQAYKDATEAQNALNTSLYNWGDVIMTIGGKEIKPIACIDYATEDSDYTAISRFENGVYSATITISRKEAKKLREFMKLKKIRLPRKQKKKLKKYLWVSNADDFKHLPKGIRSVKSHILIGGSPFFSYIIKTK